MNKLELSFIVFLMLVCGLETAFIFKKIQLDVLCVDSVKYEAFYSKKNDMDYCFLRSRIYPYRVYGGQIAIDKD